MEDNGTLGVVSEVSHKLKGSRMANAIECRLD